MREEGRVSYIGKRLCYYERAEHKEPREQINQLIKK